VVESSIPRAVVCHSCRGSVLEPILSLGEMPLANSYLRVEELAVPEARYPLDLVRCAACSLVQITEIVPPDTLFRDYLYFSSYSATMVAHAEAIVGRLVEERHLGPSSLAVEVASNDGYLLQFYRRAGVPVLGIEPARNVAEVAEQERGVRTLAEFFGAELASMLAARGERADVIHANNVLAHVSDLNGFVEGFRTLLKDDGIVVCESPDLETFLERVEVDTIYHEHLCYYSLTALDRLFRRHGLVIEECEPLAIHGGSLRIIARRREAARVGDSVTSRLAREAAWGVDKAEPYARFARESERMKRELVDLVRGLRRSGHTVAAYGAAAKGTVLLNATGLGRDDIAFVCDKNPHKQGRVMPGVHVPIVDPAKLLEDRPDYCLLLVWNLADEIMQQQSEYRARGGKFIVPLPHPRVV
jgi:SAM-dependent methyltransferase